MKGGDERPITLTFDNGPHDEVTPRVLDILARHGIKSTFFVIGNRLAEHRAAAERAHEEGHWIGNHTWSHAQTFRDRGDSGFVAGEIDKAQAALGDLAHPDKLFRPYGARGRLDGALNQAAVDHLSRNGFTCVLWNCVPGDFENAHRWPEVALRQIGETAWPLLALHDIFAEAVGNLERFIGAVRDRGYVFRQEFPSDAIAIRNGKPTPVIEQGVLANPQSTTGDLERI